MTFISTLKTLFGASLLSLMALGSATAADQGTAPEAEALVQKAVAYIKANGPEKAYEEFNNGKSFKDRDLYVVVIGLDGMMLAHGANPKLVGKDMGGLKDADGKVIHSLYVAAASGPKRKGWTEEFKFRNPLTQKLEPKVALVERVGDTFVSVGIYKN